LHVFNQHPAELIDAIEYLRIGKRVTRVAQQNAGTLTRGYPSIQELDYCVQLFGKLKFRALKNELRHRACCGQMLMNKLIYLRAHQAAP
jgi:hypothetical protein